MNLLSVLYSYVDVLESELGAEVENGRLVRLLSKLGFINERAECVIRFTFKGFYLTCIGSS